jgi:hypothetical protein
MIFLINCTCAQFAPKLSPIAQVGPVALGQDPNPNEILITDVYGRPFLNKYADVTGSPYFNDTNKLANIILSTGRVFKGVGIRIDLVSQEAHFISANNTEGVIKSGVVTEISYNDTTAESITPYTFRTGFPPVDNLTSNNFYLVLADGRCSFLKSIVKSVSERKNPLSGEVVKEIETYENYYLFSNGVMKRWKKDPKQISTELSDHQAQIDQFISKNKINLKNKDHLISLLNYYNSL